MKKTAVLPMPGMPAMPVHAPTSGPMPASLHLDGHNGGGHGGHPAGHNGGHPASHNGAGHNGGHPASLNGAGHNGHSAGHPASHIAGRNGAPATRVASRREALARDPLSAEDILANFYRPVGQDKAVPPADKTGHALPELRPSNPLVQPLGTQQPAPLPVAEGVVKRPRSKAKPVHYKIVCISLYVEDIERLDGLVGELKRRGHTKANKSQLIRAALEQIDLDKVPKAR